MSPYRREKIENWIADFYSSPRCEELPARVRDIGRSILESWFVGACQHFDLEPEDLGESELRWGLLQRVAPMALDESVLQQVPQLGRAFLEQLQDEGRIGGGIALGRYVAALGTLLREARNPAPVRNVATKLNRNDPCPCGSGRKYKKCCMRALD